MKSRNSFVANSSSSSFIVVGRCDNLMDRYPDEDFTSYSKRNELAEQYQEETGLRVFGLEYEGDCVIGVSVGSDLDGDATKFIETVQKAIELVTEKGIANPRIISVEVEY